MNITTLLDKVYFAPRLKKIDFYANRAGELQHRVLDRLVRMAENTEWGKKYDYKSIHTYEDFYNHISFPILYFLPCALSGQELGVEVLLRG